MPMCALPWSSDGPSGHKSETTNGTSKKRVNLMAQIDRNFEISKAEGRPFYGAKLDQRLVITNASVVAT